MDRKGGYAFLMAVCAAIEDGLAAAEASDPTTLQVRGNSLRFALERELYVRFVNDDSLYAAYSGDHAAVVRGDDEVEAAVLRRLLGPDTRIELADTRALRSRLAATPPARA